MMVCTNTYGKKKRNISLSSLFLLMIIIIMANHGLIGFSETYPIEESWINDEYEFLSAVSIVPQNDYFHIFGQSADRSIYYIVVNSSLDVSESFHIGGITSSSPTTVTDSNGKTYLFVRGSDNSTLWMVTNEGDSWANWRSIEGNLSSHPAAAVSDSGLYVFVRGLSDELWYRHLNGSEWSDWTYLGGLLDSPPYAITYNGSVIVFAKGVNGNIWTISNNGTNWGAWTDHGTKIPSGPAVVTFNDQTYMFVRGSDNSTWYTKPDENGSWSDWISLGGVIYDRPSPIVTKDGKMLVLYVIGANNTLYHRVLVENKSGEM